MEDQDIENGSVYSSARGPSNVTITLASKPYIITPPGSTNETEVDKRVTTTADKIISKEEIMSSPYTLEKYDEGVIADSQMFRANKKVSEVLRDSGEFDTIDNAQVMKHRIRSLEIEKLALMVDHNNLIREFNTSVESHMEEISNLNDINKKYDLQLQELKDLTCFLDDDRKKCKRLAKEWQKFGRQTVGLLKNEVSSYEDKVIYLENREKDLIAENNELRDYCMRLDREKTTKIDSLDENEPHFKLTMCSKCSSLQKKSTKSTIKENNRVSYNSTHQLIKTQEHFTAVQKENSKWNKLLSHNGIQDKKRVSFDFPDDSDTSSAGTDYDSLELRIQQLNKEFSNLGNTDGNITPVNDDFAKDTDDETSVSSENLFSPISPKSPLKLPLQLNYKLPNDLKKCGGKQDDGKQVNSSSESQTHLLPNSLNNLAYLDGSINDKQTYNEMNTKTMLAT